MELSSLHAIEDGFQEHTLSKHWIRNTDALQKECHIGEILTQYNALK